MDGTGPLFRMEGVSKRYGGVKALTDADLVVEAGHIHGVLGENGAGKSTLMKIMAGVVQPDEGRMTLDGNPVTFTNPAAANAAGIVCIFQELSLVPELSVADNICISNPPKRFGLIDRRAQRRIAEEALTRAGGEDIHPLAPIKDLPLSRRQLVEIAKALVRKPRILILDEATSALTAADVRKVFSVLKRLRQEGLALLYISHRMAEIAELADECTVFRNGRNVGTFKSGTKSDNEIVELMIGREYSHVFPPKPAPKPTGETPALEVRNLSWNNRLKDISLTARAGEIVGLGGLDGQGQRELLLALFGVLRSTTGEILIDGKKCNLSCPNDAKHGTVGMALIPEDRKTEGLMLPMSVRDNLSMACLGKLSKGGLVDRAAETKAIDEMIALLAIKTDGTAVPVGTLSGGNQQKIVIAKWLMTKPKVILLNDPTRGIDVGTKAEIYQLLRKLADQGAAILYYSTDYDELVGCCDRVLVLYDGAVGRVLSGAEITERALVSSALNIGSAHSDAGTPSMAGAGAGVMTDHALAAQHGGDWRFWFAEQRGTLLALAVFVAMFVIYTSNHPAGFSADVVTTAANKGVLLALVAMAQTFVVLTAGIDLSVGFIFILCNCLASHIVLGSAIQTTFGVLGVLAAGLACGALNGAIVIYGRLQPIVATIATGAAFYGIALLLREQPGGDVNEDLADFLTNQFPGGIPASGVALLVVVLVIWIPFRKSMLGRVVYAVGSSEPAAYMSGLDIRRAKFIAYALGGMLASIGGLFITFVTYTGEASLTNANTYTLNSIAAVVLGGVSLFGGRGSAVGAIFGALIFRTIGDLLFVFDLDPLWQPLFLGVVLLISVCLGSFRLIRIRNRLDLFG